MPKIKLHAPHALILFSLFFATFGNLAFWKKTFSVVQLANPENLVFLISLLLFIFSAISILFILLLWPKTTKPILIILLLISAAANYFCIQYGIYIDRTMIQNMMHTSSAETISLLSPQLAIWMLLLGALPVWLLTRIEIKPIPIFKRLGFKCLGLLASMALLLAATLPLYKDYAAFFRNNKEIIKLVNPSNYLAASYAYGKQLVQSNQPFKNIGLDAKQALAQPGEKPKLVIFVLGETARAQNFSLFGYNRQTNPMLEKEDRLLSFIQTSSCGTATAISVPCMFSNMDRKDYSPSKVNYQDNVLDILKRAGIEVFWRENNTGCQGVCDRLTSDIVSLYYSKKECPEDYCLDESLLNGLDEYIAARPHKNIFIVLHTIGSHGPAYYRRYPKDMQNTIYPTCNTNQIQTCTDEELVNTYDNTILYTDQFLAKTIKLLKQYTPEYQTAMFYVSDHGESLGENGIYLHSTPYAIAPDEQTRIPMILWLSEQMLQGNALDFHCLAQAAKNNAYSQDNVFSTILGIMDISTKEYNVAKDILSSCKKPPVMNAQIHTPVFIATREDWIL